VPCVSTAVGDAGRIVGSTGRLVPPANDEALALAMREVLELTASDRRSLGEAARAHVVASFGLTAVATEYSRLYERLALRGAHS
jgi:glycosyltransferase involved in cell wall biosynthesis